MFNKEELKYLKSQLLVRVATATTKGKPNVAPVGFEFDGKCFYIGSVKQKILTVHPKVPQRQEREPAGRAGHRRPRLGGPVEGARDKGERRGRYRDARGGVRQRRVHPHQAQGLMELGTQATPRSRPSGSSTCRKSGRSPLQGKGPRRRRRDEPRRRSYVCCDIKSIAVLTSFLLRQMVSNFRSSSN